MTAASPLFEPAAFLAPRAPRRARPTPAPAAPPAADLRLALSFGPAAPPRPERIPLERKDPFGELVNAHKAEELRAVVRELELLPDDYDASCAFVRVHRPRESGPALHFWHAPVARAHVLNAVLNRDDRTLVRVQEDLDIGADKLYNYLPNWGVVFRQRARNVDLIDGTGRPRPARVLAFDRASGTAELKPDGTSLTVTARYDRQLGAYRTRELLDRELVPYGVLALMAGVTERTLRAFVPVAERRPRGNLVDLAAFEAACPPETWRMTLAEARASLNACRCALWDDTTGGCGLGHARWLARACEDHSPT